MYPMDHHKELDIAKYIAFYYMLLCAYIRQMGCAIMCLWENVNSHIKLEEPIPIHEDSIQATIKNDIAIKS